MPRIWPGFFAVWVAIILHYVWTIALLWPGAHHRSSGATPIHQVVILSGGYLNAAFAFFVVATLALVGVLRKQTPGTKIYYLLPQQMILGISAAGAILAMYHSMYADGVLRPASFIVVDQTAIVLTWIFHTIALMFLFLVNTKRLSLGGYGR